MLYNDQAEGVVKKGPQCEAYPGCRCVYQHPDNPGFICVIIDSPHLLLPNSDTNILRPLLNND